MKTQYHISLLVLALLFLGCASDILEKSDVKVKLSKTNIVSGETVVVTYDSNIDFSYNKAFLIDSLHNIVEEYPEKRNSNNIYSINRFLSASYKKDFMLPGQSYSLLFAMRNETRIEEVKLPLVIDPSIIITSLCAVSGCSYLSGNVVEGVANYLKVETLGINAVKFKYYISDLNEVKTVESPRYASPTDFDTLDNIVMPIVPDHLSSYIATIRVVAYDEENNFGETSIPIRVVKPMEVLGNTKFEIAEVYSPIPVSGCMIGTLGNNVSYSETVSETRQNSVNVTLSSSWTNSIGNTEGSSLTEGISIGETESISSSSGVSESESTQENFNTTGSSSESSNTSFATTDGESWSWSISENESTATSNSETEGNTVGANGSVTVGVSGEGSLPFIAKASGKVETTVGVNASMNNSSTTNNTAVDSSGRIYSTSGVENKSVSFGSVNTTSASTSLGGAYTLGRSSNQSVTENNGTSSTRVWNMNASISSNKVHTIGDTESIAETIVNSSTSTTTLSYSGYIPRGRSAIFYRQTSRWVRKSEIITYDIHGFPIHAGYIMMNTWRWAPELATGNDCSNIPEPLMEPATCYIGPCGE